MSTCYRAFLSCFFFAFAASFLRGQTLDLAAFRAMPDAQRLRFVHDFSFFPIDSAQLAESFAAMLPIAVAAKDERTVFALKFHHFDERPKLHLPQAEVLQILSELEALADAGGWPVERSVAHHYAFFEDFVNKKMPIERAYLEVAQDFERMEKIGFEQFRDYRPDALLFHLGKFLWDLDDREKALQYFLLAERYALPTETGARYFTNILNHIQTYHQQKKDFPNAIEYAQKIIDFHTNLHRSDTTTQWLSTFWEGLASLDIANMLVEQGKFAESEPYLQRGYKLAKTNGEKGSFQVMHAEFDVLQVVLSIKLKAGKSAEIEPLVRRSEALKKELDADPKAWFDRFKYLQYYQNLARWHESQGNFGEAMRLTRTAQALADSLSQRNDARKFEQLQQRREAEKYADRIQEIEQEKQAQRQMIFGMAVILLLLALAARLNFKRLEAKRAEAEAAQKELAALARIFQEKSALADGLRLELDGLAARNERSEHLEALARTVILTDEDWARFRHIFEKVHPGFIEEQKRTHPELSAAELRLLALEKLELGDHEIANLLGVSVKTVHQTRWRMHKKLGV